jgi:hypothetical protein
VGSRAESHWWSGSSLLDSDLASDYHLDEVAHGGEMEDITDIT